MKNKQPKKRGGSRPGSGAKKSSHGPTRRVYIPIKWIERVKQLIEEMKRGSE